jgi:predicted phosphodiesterase
MRIVCISDTHSRTSTMRNKIPNADILIHAGDFTKHGHLDEVEEFCQFLDNQTHIKHKIIIAGNHDIILDERYTRYPKQIEMALNLFKKKNITYLEDSFVKLYGLKIYGSPW